MISGRYPKALVALQNVQQTRDTGNTGIQDRPEAMLRMELTLCLSTCAVSGLSWLAVASVAVMITKVGICFNATAKFRPRASASFSLSMRGLLLRFLTTLSCSSQGVRCCLACRCSNFCICLALVSRPILSVMLLHHASSCKE